ncbi:MAG: MFS transporter [Clostridia bacterium]|nr:MFS transporter [Clostridia bacterium]
MTKREKRITFGLILSCWLAYMLSMCMKISYSASMVAIKDEYDVPNVIASLPITLYYSFYAIIQVILAPIFSKINVKRYMMVTFVISGLSFLSIFFYSPMWYICSVLALNGIMHGSVWCGSIVTLNKHLSRKTMDKTLLFLSAAFSVGSALSFGLSSLSIHLGNWRITFITLGTAFLVTTLYMFFTITRMEKSDLKPVDDENGIPLKKRVYTAERPSAKPLFVLSLISVFFSSFLYYGFANWMPTILKSNFGLADSMATLITVLFPTVAYLGPVLSEFFCNRIKNDFLVIFLSAAVVTGISLLLCFVYGLNVILTIAVIVTIGIFLRLLNNTFGVLVPLHIKNYVNYGLTSADINASASASAAASPFMIALILDLSGNDWHTGFFVLFSITLLVLTLCSVFFAEDLYYQRKTKTLKTK